MRINRGKNTTGWFNLALQRRKSSAGSNLMPLLVKHALIKGFLVGDYQHRQAEFINDVSWLQEGKLKYKEDVVEGLETLTLSSVYCKGKLWQADC